MNPFLKYRGIRLNGRLILSSDFESFHSERDFEGEVINYCKTLFDESEFTDILSSGSTGPKKKISFHKSSLIQSAEVTNSFFSLNEGSRALLALPLTYVAGKLMIVRAIIGEFDLIAIEPSSNPFKSLDKKIDFAPLTPHQLETSLKESRDQLDLIGKILLGGAPVSPSLKEEIDTLNSECYEGFGMAETLTHVALRELKGGHDDLFRPMPDVSLHQDSRGCLVIERKGITKEVLITNDLVELEDKGFRWLGRIDNLINSGGVKIIPEEVEAQLASAINANYFVGGIPDEKLGELVCLFIEGDEDVDIERISFDNKYQRPKRIVHLGAFVYTDSGKIMRKESAKKALPNAG